MPILGFEDYYEINRKGLIRGIRGTRSTIVGTFQELYVVASLRKDNAYKRLYIHRAVWEAFRGPIPAGMHINHKNSIKSDNRLSNLELATPLENARHHHKAKKKFLRTGKKKWHYGEPPEGHQDKITRYWAARGFKVTKLKIGFWLHDAMLKNGRIVKAKGRNLV